MTTPEACDSIAEAIIEYLRSVPGVQARVQMDTDLIDSGSLDSLLVLDLVCFVESRFHVKMLPADINPSNLKSAACLTRYVHGRLMGRAKAA